MPSHKNQSEFFNTTTPAQRVRIRAQQKALARQGFYPWSRPPCGFNKVRTHGMSIGLPTLKVNRTGQAIADAYPLILAGTIKSKREAASYLMASTQLALTPARVMSLLRNPVFKGFLSFENCLVKGQFTPPVSELDFDTAQSIIAGWSK